MKKKRQATKSEVVEAIEWANRAIVQLEYGLNTARQLQGDDFSIDEKQLRILYIIRRVLSSDEEI